MKKQRGLELLRQQREPIESSAPELTDESADELQQTIIDNPIDFEDSCHNAAVRDILSEYHRRKNVGEI